ncbi:catalase [Cellvibrio sp.]|jgi:catalase
MANFKGDTQAIKMVEGHALSEKIMRFEPERRVNTRAAAAHGIFQLYESQCEYTKAVFLQDPATVTPVFVRFSTLASVRGSGDCTRTPRGFAVRFFTGEGNFDLVGSNLPVMYSQYGATFADLIHAAKPEADNPAPHVSSAHNRFWDVISLNPESMHKVMWTMSDRALPRSFAMMEGFGVHTFRFVNARGKSYWVKFHWKPVLGVHSLVWDEAVKLAAKDADFHLRHLWELIDQRHFPEWELGLQIVLEEDRYKFDFDLQDATKLIPESLVPVRIVGKLTLNQNPENYFDEIEQVAFHSENLVPGIEFNNEHSAKVFTDSDIQMSRLCSANFTELPLNRSRTMIDKLKRDIQLRAFRNTDNASCELYSVENSLQKYWVAGDPVSFPETLSSEKRLATIQLFSDHFTQAALFWRSQSAWEQNHVVAAFCFELAKVSVAEIRERMVANLMQIDNTLAARVAEGLGITLPVSASSPVANIEFIEPSLSMAHTRKNVIVGRCVAVLVGNGFEGARLMALQEELVACGASVKMIGSRLGEVKCSQGRALQIDKSLATVGSVMFDAVYIPGGHRSVEALCKDANAVLFVKEAYKHGKAVAASNEGGMLITRAARSSVMSDVFKGPGVITAGPNTPTEDFVRSFIDAVAAHRFSERPDMGAIVA